MKSFCLLSLVLFATAAGAQVTVPSSPPELVNYVTYWNQAPLLPDEVLQKTGVDVLKSFPLVLLINKAASGPTAQQMKVYSNGELVKTFPVSTGRERNETPPGGHPYFSTTPTGWFAPDHYELHHHSTTWEAEMNNAIFFIGGIAVHATTPEHFKALGHRDSGGCVRLLPPNALYVWNASLAVQKSQVPEFDRNGDLTLDSSGHPVFHTAAGTLIIVIDRPDL